MVLMGTPLPAGEHTVEFIYRPAGLTVGRVISLISVVICGMFIVIPNLKTPARSTTALP